MLLSSNPQKVSWWFGRRGHDLGEASHVVPNLGERERMLVDIIHHKPRLCSMGRQEPAFASSLCARHMALVTMGLSKGDLGLCFTFYSELYPTQCKND